MHSKTIDPVSRCAARHEQTRKNLMTGESDKAAEIAQIALQYRELTQEGAMWSGGPVSAETLKLVAAAVTQSLDAGTMLRGLAESKTPEETIRGLLAIVWAQGFNVGTMYADKQGGN